MKSTFKIISSLMAAFMLLWVAGCIMQLSAPEHAFAAAVLAAGLNRSCDDKQNNGGVKKMWVANRDDIDVTGSSGAGTLTGYTYSSFTMLSSKIWYVVEPDNMTIKADYEIKTNKGVASQTKTMVEFIIPKNTSTNLTFIEALRKSCGIVVLVEFFNGAKVMYGYDEKVWVQGALYMDSTKGVGGDRPETEQNATITFRGEQIETPHLWSFTPAVS